MDRLNSYTRAARVWRVEGGGIGARGTWEQPLPALVSAPFEGVLLPTCPSLGPP